LVILAFFYFFSDPFARSAKAFFYSSDGPTQSNSVKYFSFYTYILICPPCKTIMVSIFCTYLFSYFFRFIRSPYKSKISKYFFIYTYLFSSLVFFDLQKENKGKYFYFILTYKILLFVAQTDLKKRKVSLLLTFSFFRSTRQKQDPHLFLFLDSSSYKNKCNEYFSFFFASPRPYKKLSMFFRSYLPLALKKQV